MVVITVAGEMSAALCAQFDDVNLEVGRSVTRLTVHGDQAAVHGLIRRLELLGLELLDVHTSGPG
jgi:hypothetical protein